MEDNKIYKNKDYHKAFMVKNEDKIKEKITCDVCGGKYTYFNKSKHQKSKKHIVCGKIDKYEENKKMMEIKELKRRLIELIDQLP